MTPQFADHLEFKSPNFFSGSPSAQSSSSVIWHPSSHISLWQLQRTMLCFLNAACCSKLSSSKNGLGSLVWCFKYFFNTSLVGGVVFSPQHPNLKCHHWKNKTKKTYLRQKNSRSSQDTHGTCPMFHCRTCHCHLLWSWYSSSKDTVSNTSE